MSESRGHDIQKNRTGVYHGPFDEDSFDNAIRQYENAWNREMTIGSFDDLVFQQILSAIESGRDRVTIFDLGSGSGAMLNEVVTDNKSIPKSRQILKNYPGLKLKLIGLTDAGSDEEFFTDDSTGQIDLQIEHQNIHYSITRTQTLRKFLEHQHVGQIDLIVSRWMLTYVAPGVFQDVMTDCIDRLRPISGVMVATGYAEKLLPGFVPMNPQFPNPVLDIRGSMNSTLSHYKQLLRSNVFLGRENITLAEKNVAFDKILELLLRMGLISQDDINKARQKVKKMLEPAEPDYRELQLLYSEIVFPALETNAEQKITRIKEKKQQILEEVRMSGRVQLSYSDSTIFINNKKTDESL